MDTTILLPVIENLIRFVILPAVGIVLLGVCVLMFQELAGYDRRMARLRGIARGEIKTNPNS